MLDRFSTNATVAKAKAMYGKRLKLQDYRELLHRGTVNEAAEYLKRNTHYHDILAAIDTNTVHRGYLETLLQREAFERYVALCKFQGLDKKPYYNYEIRRREIEEIVSCVQHLNAGNSENFIATVPVFMLKHASFDLMALARVRSFKDLLQIIAKTDYYSAIEKEKPDQNGQYNCTSIEAHLRIAYYTWFHQLIEKDFDSKTADDLHQMLYTQADFINIMNTFRISAFREAGSDVSEIPLLPSKKAFNKAHHELLFASNTDEFIRQLQHFHYGRQLSQEVEKLNVSTLELAVSRLRQKRMKMKLRSAQSAPVSVFAILFLFDVEVQNITTIIEGIRYQVPTNILEKLIIL